jgi:hypothetical protein
MPPALDVEAALVTRGPWGYARGKCLDGSESGVVIPFYGGDMRRIRLCGGVTCRLEQLASPAAERQSYGMPH